MKTESRRALGALGVGALLVACVLVLAETTSGQTWALPTVRGLWRELRERAVPQELALDLLATAARVLTGVAVAVPCGGALGLALAAQRRTWRYAEPVTEFVRAVPPALLYPMCLLAFGYGEGARIATIALGNSALVLVHVARSLATAPTARGEAATIAGLSRWQRARSVEFYELLPGLLSGTRFALAGGLVVSVVTEMLVGARHGLGARAQMALIEYRPEALWLVVALAGALGSALVLAVGVLERRWTPWVWEAEHARDRAVPSDRSA